MVARYSEVIDQVLPLDSALLRGVNSTEVNGLANALGALSAARNEVTLQQATIAAATVAGEPGGAELGGLPASEARLSTSLNNYRTALDTGQRVRFAEMIAGPANSDRNRLVQELSAADPAIPLPSGTGVRASKVYGDFLAELDAAETGIRDEVAAITEAARTTAANLAVLNVAVLLAALIIGAIIVGLITRAIISSLRTLRSSALEVAQKSLPDAVQRMRGGTVPDVNVTPVPVHTREEVGEVARAFDAVHEQAVRLAAEQATLQNAVNSMFVNLSRRSQSLVDRQLQLIEELESNEQDPEQLASLFRLDHLATRMRRNSENLLVLADSDLAKRTTHHVPVVDVLQAAVSEVEQYERVTVEQPPAVAVLGRAANDLQHLLSELLDNATSFSPPETSVVMSTSRAGTGPLVVEIVDRGIGMRPEEMEDVNRRFADADDSRMTASRRMGLFVVGRLAARHGVRVRLIAGAPTPDPTSTGPGRAVTAKGSGVTARVTIPAHLVTSGPAGSGRRPEQARSTTAVRPGSGAPPVVVPPQRDGGDRSRVTTTAEGASDDRAASSAGGGQPPHNGSGPSDAPDVARPAPALGPPEAGQRRPAEAEAEAEPDAARNGDGAEPPAADPSEVPTPDRGQSPVSGVAAGEPGAADPTAGMDAPELFGPSPVLDADETPTSQTPIFEEVASGWFRSYRQVPINWQPDQDGAVPDEIDRSRPVRPSAAAAVANATGAGSAPTPTPTPTPAGRPAVVPQDFVSAADDGWRAAVEVREESARMDTVAGTDLPRRTPGARLLPGGIAPGVGGASRDADAIRSRLSNYQRGVRSGRSERDRAEPEGGSTVDAGTPGSAGTETPGSSDGGAASRTGAGSSGPGPTSDTGGPAATDGDAGSGRPAAEAGPGPGAGGTGAAAADGPASGAAHGEPSSGAAHDEPSSGAAGAASATGNPAQPDAARADPADPADPAELRPAAGTADPAEPRPAAGPGAAADAAELRPAVDPAGPVDAAGPRPDAGSAGPDAAGAGSSSAGAAEGANGRAEATRTRWGSLRPVGPQPRDGGRGGSAERRPSAGRTARGVADAAADTAAVGAAPASGSAGAAAASRPDAAAGARAATSPGGGAAATAEEANAANTRSDTAPSTTARPGPGKARTGGSAGGGVRSGKSRSGQPASGQPSSRRPAPAADGPGSVGPGTGERPAPTVDRARLEDRGTAPDTAPRRSDQAPSDSAPPDSAPSDSAPADPSGSVPQDRGTGTSARIGAQDRTRAAGRPDASDNGPARPAASGAQPAERRSGRPGRHELIQRPTPGPATPAAEPRADSGAAEAAEPAPHGD